MESNKDTKEFNEEDVINKKQNDEALYYHEYPIPGKYVITPIKAMNN
jgi:hypothetical protein